MKKALLVLGIVCLLIGGFVVADHLLVTCAETNTCPAPKPAQPEPGPLPRECRGLDDSDAVEACLEMHYR